MSFDFPNAIQPNVAALSHSFVADDIERELRQLFIDLFIAHFATDTFNANVLGAGHLSTESMINKAINMDGLVPVKAASTEAAMRYLYRAWKSKARLGRGLAFLRTYLQLLFPNEFAIEQLWHSRSRTYPDNAFLAGEKWYWRHAVGDWGLKLDGTWRLGEWYEGQNVRTIMRANLIGQQGLRVDGTWRVGERFSVEVSELEQKAFLTSRVMITFDHSTLPVESLLAIIRAVIPARIVPTFRAQIVMDNTITGTLTGSVMDVENVAPPVSTFDYMADFHVEEGTNEGIWTYGYLSDLDLENTFLSLYGAFWSENGFIRWYFDSSFPNCMKNEGESPSENGLPAGRAAMQPGAYQYSCARFTVPTTGSWTITVHIDPPLASAVDIYLFINAALDSSMLNFSGPDAAYLLNEAARTLTAEDTVSLVIGTTGDYMAEVTPLDFTLNYSGA